MSVDVEIRLADFPLRYEASREAALSEKKRLRREPVSHRAKDGPIHRRTAGKVAMCMVIVQRLVALFPFFPDGGTPINTSARFPQIKLYTPGTLEYCDGALDMLHANSGAWDKWHGGRSDMGFRNSGRNHTEGSATRCARPK